MPKYLIIWDCGYGPSEEVIEADNQEEANKTVYEAWREDAEANAHYDAILFTKEVAEEHGLEEQFNDNE